MSKVAAESTYTWTTAQLSTNERQPQYEKQKNQSTLLTPLIEEFLVDYKMIEKEIK